MGSVELNALKLRISWSCFRSLNEVVVVGGGVAAGGGNPDEKVYPGNFVFLFLMVWDVSWSLWMHLKAGIAVVIITISGRKLYKKLL